MQGFWCFGRLGRDPEGYTTSTGKSVTKFSLAVNMGKDKPPMWLDCACWGEYGERLANMVEKGAELFCQGSIALNEWEGKDGTKRSNLAMDVYRYRVISGWRKKDVPPVSEPAPADDEANTDEDIPF